MNDDQKNFPPQEAIPSESHDFQATVGKTLAQLLNNSQLPPKAAMMVVAVAKKMIASRDNGMMRFC